MGRVDEKDDNCADASGGMTGSAALLVPFAAASSLSRFLRRWGSSRSDAAELVVSWALPAGALEVDHEGKKSSLLSDELSTERLAEK